MYMNGSMFECERCGLPLGVSHYFSNKTDDVLCSDCMMEEDPPILLIARDNENQRFWNFSTNSYELWQTDLAKFKACGWFIRRHVTTIGSAELTKTTAFFKHRYTLEYHGARRCLRFLNYEYFDTYMPKCDGENCGFDQIRSYGSSRGAK